MVDLGNHAGEQEKGGKAGKILQAALWWETGPQRPHLVPGETHLGNVCLYPQREEPSSAAVSRWLVVAQGSLPVSVPRGPSRHPRDLAKLPVQSWWQQWLQGEVGRGAPALPASGVGCFTGAEGNRRPIGTFT